MAAPFFDAPEQSGFPRTRIRWFLSKRLSCDKLPATSGNLTLRHDHIALGYLNIPFHNHIISPLKKHTRSFCRSKHDIGSITLSLWPFYAPACYSHGYQILNIDESYDAGTDPPNNLSGTMITKFWSSVCRLLCKPITRTKWTQASLQAWRRTTVKK